MDEYIENGRLCSQPITAIIRSTKMSYNSIQCCSLTKEFEQILASCLTFRVENIPYIQYNNDKNACQVLMND